MKRIPILLAALLAPTLLSAQSLVLKNSTDQTRYVFLVDSTAGTPETGYTITSLDLQYTRNRETPATKVDAVALAATNTAHTDNRCIEIDATSSPGLYRCDWPDAAFATGADKVQLVVSGTGIHPAIEEVQLVDFNPQDAVRLGLTALPNAAADAAGGLPISDAGGLDLDTVAANVASTLADTGTDGVVLANDAITAAKIAADAIGASEIAASAIGAAEIADGAIDAATFAAGAIDAAAIATDAIGAAEVATGALTKGTEIAGFNDLSAAQVNAEADSAIETYHLDHLLAATYDPASKPGAADALLNELVESDAGVSRFTANALEQAPSGGLDAAGVRAAVGLAAANLDTQLDAIPTAGENADAAWEEAIADHSGTSGSTAEALNAAGSAGDPWVTALPGAYGSGSAGFIIGTNLDTTVSSRLAPTTAGRTLDVTAGGEAGIDLDNTSGTLAKTTEITGFNDLSAASVNAEVDAALADIRLDELLSADSDIDGAAPPTVGSVFHEALTKSAGSFTYDQTTDSPEAIRDNMGTAQTGDSFARLGAPAGASVSADVAAVKAETAAILDDTDDIGVAGAGLTEAGGTGDQYTAIPWNGSVWDAEVQSEAADALNAYDPPTNAEMVADNDVTQTAVAAISTTIGVAGIGLTAIPSADVVKNAALANFVFLMVDATDHVTPETGLTVTGQLSCDAGAFAGVTGTIAEIGSGFYQFDAATADTNCDLATWKFSASGADTYSVQFRTRQ